MIDYHVARRIHLTASGLIAAIAVVHIGLAFPIYREWRADAVWFVGSGLGILLLAALNFTHIGVEPCHQPTARFVRAANWLYAVFALFTLLAVPELQTIVLVLLMLIQSLMASRTLPGPGTS